MNILISQPMNGLTKNQIRENREKVVQELEAQGHTILDSIFPDFDESNIKNVPLYYLAKSFELIAEQADAVYFLNGWRYARGCSMEFEACTRYLVKTLFEGVKENG